MIYLDVAFAFITSAKREKVLSRGIFHDFFENMKTRKETPWLSISKGVKVKYDRKEVEKRWRKTRLRKEAKKKNRKAYTMVAGNIIKREVEGERGKV